MILDGEFYSNDVCNKLSAFLTKHGRPKVSLKVVLVGENPASKVYVGRKKAKGDAIGIAVDILQLPEDISQNKLLTIVSDLNLDESVDAIIVQMPLPKHINSQVIMNAVSESKDVDGFTVSNLGQLFANYSKVFAPCTAAGSLYLVKKALGNNLTGKHAVVVGRSIIVGKPSAAMLINENCSVTIVHSQTPNPSFYTKNADILIVAAGRKKLINASWVKEGAVVIDVGINVEIDSNGNRQLYGDVDFHSVAPLAKAITPVPRGVGPMTVAFLMKNTIEAASYRLGCAKEFAGIEF